METLSRKIQSKVILGKTHDLRKTAFEVIFHHSFMIIFYTKRNDFFDRMGGDYLVVNFKDIFCVIGTPNYLPHILFGERNLKHKTLFIDNIDIRLIFRVT